jgi:biopolymer transport protein ExbD
MSLPAWTPSKSLAARAAKRKSNYFLYLNLWPFVTVMVGLLFLFMPLTVVDVNGPPACPQCLPSTSRSPRRLDAFDTITRDGKFFVSSSGDDYHQSAVRVEDLAPRLRDAAKNSVYKELYIDADARCAYSDVKTAINQLRAAGITHLVFLTELPPSPTASAE